LLFIPADNCTVVVSTGNVVMVKDHDRRFEPLLEHAPDRSRRGRSPRSR